jgi:hypothetical protein
VSDAAIVGWIALGFAVLMVAAIGSMIIESIRSSKHNFTTSPCPAPRCRNRSGCQCRVCGHYFAANQVRRGGGPRGTWTCSPDAGHNAIVGGTR